MKILMQCVKTELPEVPQSEKMRYKESYMLFIPLTKEPHVLLLLPSEQTSDERNEENLENGFVAMLGHLSQAVCSRKLCNVCQ